MTGTEREERLTRGTLERSGECRENPRIELKGCWIEEEM